MKLTKQLITCLTEQDIKQGDDGSFIFPIATPSGLVSMMIRVDEKAQSLYFDSATALSIPDVKLDDCYNMLNTLNRRFDLLKLIIYPKDKCLGCSIAWINVDILDIRKLDEYIGICAEGLSYVLPAFITLARSKLTINESLNILDSDYAKA